MKRDLPLLLAAAVLLAGSARADDEEMPLREDGEVKVTEEIQRAIERGHEFLVRRQDQTSGAFDAQSDYKLAITAFSCLSLMAGGNLPGRGRYSRNVEKGLDYLVVECISSEGYFKRKDDKSRMHGHGYALLALAQAYGMEANAGRRDRYRDAIRDGIRLTVSAQTREGGWGYESGDVIHEGSVTVIQLQALRAAREAGFSVPIETIEKAREYLRLSSTADGSFKYRLDHPGAHTSFPLTAAGVASLQARGDYAAKELERGLEFMSAYKYPIQDRVAQQDKYYASFFYYGQFYAAQAFYHATERNYWKEWYPAMVEQLLSTTYYNRTGYSGPHWKNSRFGDVYATAIATLVLSIPYKYLPIFQR